MAFQVVYVAGGELDKVRKVDYVKEIKNFAQLSQPYNKMVFMELPAMQGVYNLEWISPNEEMELLAITVTCSGYSYVENDYYNIYVNNEKWFDTWFPTEIKEGLYIGTSTYVYKLEPESSIKMKYMNMSGTSKKVWLGIRLLREKSKEPDITLETLEFNPAIPEHIGIPDEIYIERDAANLTQFDQTDEIEEDDE